MKKSLVLFLLLVAGVTSYSQITITSADLPSANDTVLVSVSTQYSTVDYTNTGAGQIWDYSGLIASSQKIDTFYNMSGANFSYQVVFNNGFSNPDYDSDYYNKLSGNSIPAVPGGIITIEDPVYFTKNSNSNSSVVGLGLKINGSEIPAKADTIDVVYHYPMNFSDSWDSTSYIYLDLNPVFNGMFKRNQSRSSEVDGWGQITTPFGTFDALRVRSVVTYYDSIYIDLGFGGLWNDLGTPQDIEYTWWTNDNKIPVLRIVEQNGTASAIEYRDHEVEIGAGLNEKNTMEIGIFPNPASEIVTIRINNNSTYLIDIMDISGKIVYSNQVNYSSQSIDVSAWEIGVYLVKVTNGNKITTQSLVIK
jgi:hypothetical protein